MLIKRRFDAPVALVMLLFLAVLVSPGASVHGMSQPAEPVESSHVFVAVSVGGGFACAVRSDGKLVCWHGGWSRGTEEAFPDRFFVSVSSGGTHLCGVQTNGAVECRGWGYYGTAPPPPGAFDSVSAGELHTCGVRTDGTVECWGSNTDFRDEYHTACTDDDMSFPPFVDCDPDPNDVTTYGQATPPEGIFTSVSAGEFHTCGIRTDGTVACWGSNQYGQAAPPDGVFSSVSAGDRHTCGVRIDGTVACWGSNQYGQAAPPDRGFSSVSAGAAHTCGVRSDSTLECWGASQPGMLAPPGRFRAMDVGRSLGCGLISGGIIECWGDNPSHDVTVLPGGEIYQAMSGVAAISPQGGNCGLLADGALVCWSDVPDGQAPPDGVFKSVGDRCAVRITGEAVCWDLDYNILPNPPEGSFDFVSAGGHHTCGIEPGGDVGCWGADWNGQATPAVGEFKAVSVGHEHSCGVRSDGSLACWGSNWHGQTASPQGEFRAVSAGHDHSCGVRINGSLECWGNLFRYLDPLSVQHDEQIPTDSHDDPFDIVTLPDGDFDTVSSGEANNCGVQTDGMVQCWPSFWYVDHELSQPPVTALRRQEVPPVPFVSVSVGSNHACGLRPNGRVICWGDQIERRYVVGRAVRGSPVRATEEAPTRGLAPSPLPAAPRPGSVGFTAVSAGDLHACGLRPDGSVDCWGWNSAYYDEHYHGEMGLWMHFNSPRPQSEPFTQLSTGAGHGCAVAAGGAVGCWGRDGGYIVGSSNGDFYGKVYLSYGRATPPAGTFQSVSAGQYHTCGVRTDGTVQCWGYNSNFWGSKHIGQATPPAGTFQSVSAGHYHTCGVTTDGDAVCWGSNHDREYEEERAPGHNGSPDAVHREDAADHYLGQADAPEGEFQSISAGGLHSCAVSDDASVVCWGDNSSGQASPPEGAFRSVGAGQRHSCGLTTDGTARCWGPGVPPRSNVFSGPHAVSPTYEPDLLFQSLSVGQHGNCGLRPDGTVYCWGSAGRPPENFHLGVSGSALGYECGVGSAGEPVCWDPHGNSEDIPPPHRFTAIEASGSTLCGSRADGTAACWDDAKWVVGFPSGPFQSVDAGPGHACGVQNDGNAVCWGTGDVSVELQHPRYGYGGFKSVSTGRSDWPVACGVAVDDTVECWGPGVSPYEAMPDGAFQSVSVGDFICGVTLDGPVRCWDFDIDREFPVQVNPPGGEFRSVSVGNRYACGLKTNHRVVCWGWPETGNRRAGTYRQFLREAPPYVRFTSVSAGTAHACGTKMDSTVVCWGDDAHGKTTPPPGTFSAVAAADDFTCGLREDGTLVCWGKLDRGLAVAYGPNPPIPGQ